MRASRERSDAPCRRTPGSSTYPDGSRETPRSWTLSFERRRGEPCTSACTIGSSRCPVWSPDDGLGHPILEPIRQTLSDRYGEQLERLSLAMYRDGKDSVAWHGDRVARRMATALVATVSVGSPRRFLLRPYGGSRSIPLRLGSGLLLLHGRSHPAHWQHCRTNVSLACN